MLSISFLSAQITITVEDAPQIGDSLTFATDTMPAPDIVPGVAGEDQTWDFSGLVPADTFAIKVVPLEQTPDADTFPDANVAIDFDSVFLYAELSEEALLILGTAVDILGTGMPFVVRLDPAQKFIQFPTTYGTNYTSASRFSVQIDALLINLPYDSIRLVRSTFDTITADAYGTLTTPLDTYDALRLQVKTRTVDSVFVQAFGFWAPFGVAVSDSRQYQWLAREARGNVVTMSMNEDGGVQSVDWLTSIDQEALAPAAAFNFEDLGGGTFAFSDASTNAPTSWLWDFGDGTTSAEQNPQHTYVMGGRYDVCLTAANRAGSGTTCREIDFLASSTEQLERDYGFRLFPNPAGPYLTIELARAATAGTLITFSNLVGQTVLRQELGLTQQLYTGAWPAGTYIFLVHSAQGKLLGSGKVLVE